MKKTTLTLSVLATLLWGQALHAETYTYTGPNFTDVAGGYTTSMSVTASFTTSAPIPTNETGYDITPLVTNWSMSDGVNTLQNGPDSYLYAVVDTDSAGHIVGGLIGATYALSVPPLAGDTVDEITIRGNPPLNIGADDKLCTVDDGEQCTSYDSSASFGWVEGYGEWTGFQINAGLNDAWVSEDAPFQGLFFTVFPDLKFFFLSWFTFDSVIPLGDDTAVFGAFDQRWVTGGGFYSGNSVTVNVELTSGGIFNGSDPKATQQPTYGTITIVFNNCNEAVLTYDFPSPGLSGQMTLARVLPDNVALCQALNDSQS